MQGDWCWEYCCYLEECLPHLLPSKHHRTLCVSLLQAVLEGLGELAVAVLVAGVVAEEVVLETQAVDGKAILVAGVVERQAGLAVGVVYEAAHGHGHGPNDRDLFSRVVQSLQIQSRPVYA